eukprot:TRINITY_DN22987_c0_g1_i1.p2 TRINITY_DN22987_c0_g1~~TRINITY_DN22987_c0_g1_i1.p2  ORF type:complete len:170 (+),score=34.52 TRINITY_DN22987_c0_g1_i1:176-685(+)
MAAVTASVAALSTVSPAAVVVGTAGRRSLSTVNAVATRHCFLGAPLRRTVARTAVPRRQSGLSVRAETTQSESPDVNAIVEDLKAKWDAVENKSTVAIYAGGALVALWFSSTIVGAINSVPLLPKIMELVGLGYTGWFVYRYLLFKSSRKELVSDIEELKSKITGVGKD